MFHHDGPDPVEAGPTNRCPPLVGGKCRRGRFDGARVPIDAEQLHLRIGIEECDGVPGTPERGVDDESRWHRGEEVDDLTGHDRLVCERLGHPQPPDRHNACGWDSRVTSVEVGGGGVFQRCGRGAAHGPDAGDVHVISCDDLQRGLIGRQVVFGVDVDGVGAVRVTGVTRLLLVFVVSIVVTSFTPLVEVAILGQDDDAGQSSSPSVSRCSSG